MHNFYWLDVKSSLRFATTADRHLCCDCCRDAQIVHSVHFVLYLLICFNSEKQLTIKKKTHCTTMPPFQTLCSSVLLHLLKLQQQFKSCFAVKLWSLKIYCLLEEWHRLSSCHEPLRPLKINCVF